MQVADSLAAVRAGVDHCAEALLQPLRGRDLRRDGEQVAEQRGVFARGVGERGEVGAGDDEKVYGRLRGDVAKRERVRVLVERRHGEVAAGNPAEKAVHAAQNTPAKQPWRLLSPVDGDGANGQDGVPEQKPSPNDRECPAALAGTPASLHFPCCVLLEAP